MPKKTLVKVFAVLAVAAIAFATITSFGGKDTVSESAAGLPAVTGNAGEAPTITPPTGAAPATLQTQDIIVGTGTEVLPTSTLTVHYTLMTWSNGALVESS
jgi:peptidylprolyl isomerase